MTRAAPRVSVAAMINDSSHPTSAQLLGRACVAGATVAVILAATTQAVQTDTDIPTHQLSYPWWSEAAVLFYLLAAGSQLLLAAGVLGLRRSGVAGTGRAADLGLLAAITGTALIAVGDLATIPLRHELVDSGWPRVVEAIFAVGTVVSTLGFLVAGRATVRAGVWTDWRRFTPLAIGIWSVALVGLQFTSLLPTAVGIYALCFLALGVALAGSGHRAPVAPRAGAQRA